MAELKDFGVPGVGPGIPMPQMANKFRIVVGRQEILTLQTTKIKISMKDRLITHWVEQPAGFADEMLRAIDSISNRFNVEFSVDLLDGSGNTVSSIKGYLKTLSHELQLDYANGEPATHVLVYSYEPTAI